MADNPFDPKYPLSSLLGMYDPPAPKPALPVSPLGYGALSGLFRTSQPAVGSLLSPTLKAAVKRKEFFSFHYDDIMRVGLAQLHGLQRNEL